MPGRAGLFIHPGFNNPGDSRYRPLTGLVVRENDFQRLFYNAGAIVEHRQPLPVIRRDVDKQSLRRHRLGQRQFSLVQSRPTT